VSNVLEKKLKKYAIDPKEASLNDALEKVSKIVRQFNMQSELLYKNYEEATKYRSQMLNSRDIHNGLTAELEKVSDQRKIYENLHASFMKKYTEELKIAQDYEAQGQIARTKIIEELQSRVKLVQDQYEESGRLKI